MTLVEVVVALAITGVTVAGIVNGYIYCSTATVKDQLYMAANSRVLERMEEVRAARWDTSSYPAVDQLTTTNFPDRLVTLQNAEAGGFATLANLRTTISQISDTPPIRRIRVDCFWSFRGKEVVTNTIETCRAPDQ